MKCVDCRICGGIESGVNFGNAIDVILSESMPFLSSLRKPQYVLRPRWAVRRILSKIGLASAPEEIDLPWGKLHIDIRDTVGRALAAQGLYDLVTTEVLWRLTDEGATVFDVGANIGYFTTLLARRVGPNGRVVAFEPHPETLQWLQRNASGIRNRNVRVEEVALSDTDGVRERSITLRKKSRTPATRF